MLVSLDDSSQYLKKMFQNTNHIYIYISLLKIAIEIVDLPMNNGDFPVRFLLVYHSFVGFNGIGSCLGNPSWHRHDSSLSASSLAS